MNDIQAKENIYNAATAAVIERQESLSAATEQVTQIKEAYLRSMVHTAVLSEKARRKKDSLAKTIVRCSLGIITLISFMFSSFGGIMVAFASIAWLATQKGSQDASAGYYFRKNFFSEYAHAIPANEQLKWKGGPVIQENNNDDSADR